MNERHHTCAAAAESVAKPRPSRGAWGRIGGEQLVVRARDPNTHLLEHVNLPLVSFPAQAALVLLFLEAGLVRRKNTMNIVMKNVIAQQLESTIKIGVLKKSSSLGGPLETPKMTNFYMLGCLLRYVF